MPVIRLLGADDVEALHGLYEACFDEPFGAESFRTLLATPGMWAVLAFPDDAAAAPSGFAVARSVADEAEIVSIGVMPHARRQGVGAALLADTLARAAAQGAASVFLEVAEDNPAARALYVSAGFEKVGRRPGYYRRKTSGPVAALIMRYIVKKSVSYWKY
jgi:ribosomal-protein-alanine N-acetyltransferase